jgi:hypothetical protein
MMKHVCLALAAVGLGFAAPAAAQNMPMTSGDYVEMTSVSIDDGHNMDYANFLATKWKAQEEFAKSQGWITGYEILANANKRPGEPDLYLVVRYRSLPDAAEQAHRDQVMHDHAKMDDAAMDADSAGRAKFRHVTGSQLLQVLAFK